MRRFNLRLSGAFGFVRVIGATLLLLIGIQDSGRSALAAVIFDGVARDNGVAALLHPTGVAVDSLGNFYAVDASKHRVVKFDKDGTPKRIFGREGQGNGQLYYPQGIAVGTHSVGDTVVYVADSANSRIVLFSDSGAYLGKFGDAAPGGLNHPAAVAFLKNRTSDGGIVIVGDHRNNRVVAFTDKGAFLKSFQCSTCPAGGIRPLGVSARWNDNGTPLTYVADELTGDVQVINNGGGWVRTIGKGQLHAADDVAVDDEGNVYVADGAFGYERLLKFAPGGKLLFVLNTTGSEPFISPHGVALDEQGKIHVALTGLSDVYRFREEASALGAYAGLEARSYWINTKGAWFHFYYNGLEQTCRGGVTATITAPAGPTGKSFTVSEGPVAISNETSDTKADLTTAQVNLIRQAWTNGKKIRIAAKFTARCQDGKLLQKTLTYLK